MLTRQANERLTQVGAGTPMGTLLRRYWLPIRPTSQLRKADVLPVRILGENLVLFQSLQGEIGLVGEFCPHRMAQLKYGFPGEKGLRCCYHGWMFAPDGRCVDIPMETEDQIARSGIRVAAYPVREMGGLVWAYLGPEPVPALPCWDIFVEPNAIRQIGIMELPCNWLQAHENSGDPIHSAALHGEYFRYVLKKKGAYDGLDLAQHEALDARSRLGAGLEGLWCERSPYGMRKGMTYSKALGASRDYRSEHSTVIFPFFTQTGGPGQVRQEIQIRVPVDDVTTYHINYGCFLGLCGVTLPAQESIPWYEVPLFEADGRPVLDNILSQDAHAWIAQGPITDRTKEHLRASDLPIIQMRKQFDEQLKAIERGDSPMNVFPDDGQCPKVLHGGKWEMTTCGAQSKPDKAASAYNKGYNIHEDANRYGPEISRIVSLIEEVGRRSSPSMA